MRVGNRDRQSALHPRLRQSYLDHKPDYSAEVLADWQEERIELFGAENWKRVRRALAALSRLGIHYYDAKPGNVELGNDTGYG